MNIIHLDVFSRLIEYGNLSRVAKELGVSQPTVTMRIKALEAEVGVPLIHRVGNKISITPAGKTFFAYAQRSLRVLKDGMDTLSISENNSAVRLPIAGTHTTSTHFLPSLIGDFIRERPEWETPLHTGSTREVVEMILDEVAHVGFIGGKLIHPDIVSFPIYKYSFCLVAPPEHPLSGRDGIHIFDLKNEPLLISQKNANSSYMIQNLFREHCMAVNIIMELKNSDTVKRMVIAGHGIAFLPSIAVEKDVQAGRLTILPLHLSTSLTREISLIFRKSMLVHKPLIDFLHYLLLQLSKSNPSCRSDTALLESLLFTDGQELGPNEIRG